MKTAYYFVFTLIGCAASMDGLAYAAPRTASSQQASSASSTNTAADNRGNVEPGAPVDASKTNRPDQLSNNTGHSVLGNATKLHRPGSTNPGFPAKGGSIQNNGGRPAFPVRRDVVRSSTASLIVVRHRTPNPAVVGGLANTNAKNAGAINGARMNRKP